MSEQETTNEPEEMIRDTYAPITISMAVMMIFWGLLSHPFGINIWWMSIAGLGQVQLDERIVLRVERAR